MTPTNPPPKKAREFWIDQCGSDDEDNYAGTALYIHPRQGPLLWQSCLIHVIEISAVTRLQVQLAEAKKALEHSELEIHCCIVRRAPPSQVLLDEVRAALAKINSLDEVENGE